MKSFEFIGIGGSTNIDLGGNCCYLREGDKLLLIDVCEEATKKLMKVGAFNGVKNLYIAITHTHYDHIAGLGVLVWYCYYHLGLRPNIIYGDDAYRGTIGELLRITGVSEKLVQYVHEGALKFGFTVRMVPTPHALKLKCFGILFEDADGKYYYSGDTNDISTIRMMSGDPSIKRLYCEVRSKTSNEHIYYGDVLDLDKKKLVLMHFNTVDLYQKAIEDGFMVAKLAQALV